MTGIHVVSSNYAGTTVTYTEGTLKLGDATYTLIDVPGTYSLEATSEAEAVAISFLNSKPVAVICVLDSTNLERNIKLGLELQKYNVPIVYALNLVDVAKRHGYEINVGLLSQELGAPVIPTVAVKGEGINELKEALKGILNLSRSGCSNCSSCPGCKGMNWIFGTEPKIADRVRIKVMANLAFRQTEGMVKPWPEFQFYSLLFVTGCNCGWR